MIEIDAVAKDIGKCCQQKLEGSPVNCDLPRLARRFVLQQFQGQQFEPVTFSKDVKKDKLETVLYGLLTELIHMLNPDTVNENVSLDTFLKEVNLEFVESISGYLLNHYGEAAPLNRMLKACSQSVVISTLPHLREALNKNNILFKDCRGDWIIYFDTGQDCRQPSVKQRRKEQVYRFASNGGLEMLYKFEWEIDVIFDSLKVNEITTGESSWKFLTSSLYRYFFKCSNHPVQSLLDF
jgi:hypothetical protein